MSQTACLADEAHLGTIVEPARATRWAPWFPPKSRSLTQAPTRVRRRAQTGAGAADRSAPPAAAKRGSEERSADIPLKSPPAPKRPGAQGTRTRPKPPTTTGNPPRRIQIVSRNHRNEAASRRLADRTSAPGRSAAEAGRSTLADFEEGALRPSNPLRFRSPKTQKTSRRCQDLEWIRRRTRLCIPTRETDACQRSETQER